MKNEPLPDYKVAEIERMILSPMRSNVASDAAISRILDVPAWRVKIIREKLIKLGASVPENV